MSGVESLLTVKEYMQAYNKSSSEVAALLGVLPNNRIYDIREVNEKIEVSGVESLLTVKEYMQAYNKSSSEVAALLGVLPNNMHNYIRSSKTKDFDLAMRAQKLGIDIEFIGKDEKVKRVNQESENTILKDWQIDVLHKTGVTIVKKLFTRREIDEFIGKDEKVKRVNQESENTILKDWQIDVLHKTGVTIVKKLFTRREIELAAKKSNLNVDISDLNLQGDCPCYLVRVINKTKGCL